MSSGFNSSGNGFLGGGGDGSGPPTGIPISSLTGAEESNSIDNGSFVQQWFWNQLSGLGLSLESVSTNAGGAGQVLFSAGLSGANASANRETKAASLRNAHTGTNSTNIAALFEATDGTTNIAGDFMATGLGTNIAIRVQAGSVDLGSQGSQAGIINFIGLNSGRVGVQPADDGNDWDFVLPQNPWVKASIHHGVTRRHGEDKMGGVKVFLSQKNTKIAKKSCRRHRCTKTPTSIGV